MPTQTLTASFASDEGRTCPTPNLVLYDGQCPLCHRVVRFFLRVDRNRQLCYAPLQGKTARRIREHQEIPEDLSTVVYLRDFGLPSERIYERSSAVLSALADVGGLWWVVSWLRIVPRPLRDLVYGWVARNRIRWFGRFDSCPLPKRDHGGLFLP
ncbi:MAG: DCC1-like thiol-disulfide oxidoreductase family protein [Thermoanaerobaculia bacterium]|nr:DCC1-like thiol-disulfide oxidoreductase family protein [Thermoanaerobaculia bacterium]